MATKPFPSSPRGSTSTPQWLTHVAVSFSCDFPAGYRGVIEPAGEKFRARVEVEGLLVRHAPCFFDSVTEARTWCAEPQRLDDLAV